jgi:hypothetical protein
VYTVKCTPHILPIRAPQSTSQTPPFDGNPNVRRSAEQATTAAFTSPGSEEPGEDKTHSGKRPKPCLERKRLKRRLKYREEVLHAVQRPLSPPGGLDTVLAAEVTQADAVIYSIGIDTTFTYNPAEGVRPGTAAGAAAQSVVAVREDVPTHLETVAKIRNLEALRNYFTPPRRVPVTDARMAPAVPATPGGPHKVFAIAVDGKGQGHLFPVAARETDPWTSITITGSADRALLHSGRIGYTYLKNFCDQLFDLYHIARRPLQGMELEVINGAMTFVGLSGGGSLMGESAAITASIIIILTAIRFVVVGSRSVHLPPARL